jgi:hypothetical protein
MNDLNTAAILRQQQALLKSIATQMDVEPEISSDDMLFDFLVRSVFPTQHSGAVEAYLKGGADCAQRFSALCREHLKSEPKSILEFASGFGRVTRHVKKLFPNTSWTCSDVHPRAVNFCRCTLGVDALLSPTVPEDWVVSRKFDVVFALSFFSHMPHSRFSAWLKGLLDAVIFGGILIFTTHGATSLRNMKAGGLNAVFDSKGFFWDAHSDQRDLDSIDYGTSAVSFNYVQRALNTLPNAELVRFQQAFWWGHQDLYVVQNLSGSNETSL